MRGFKYKDPYFNIRVRDDYEEGFRRESSGVKAMALGDFQVMYGINDRDGNGAVTFMKPVPSHSDFYQKKVTSRPKTTVEVSVDVFLGELEPFVASIRIGKADENGELRTEEELIRLATERVGVKCEAAIQDYFFTKKHVPTTHDDLGKIDIFIGLKY